MRVGARCVGLDSLLIGVHLGSPAAMNAATPLRSQETFLTTFQRFFLPSGRRLQSAARLRRRWVGLAVMAPSGMTDYGHFNNLAFLKSPLQSAVNYFPSQFITSCLLWTCPAFTNCNCVLFFFFLVLGGVDYYTRTIISVNHPRTPRGQTWSAVGSRRALNQFLLDRFFFFFTTVNMIE